MREARAFGGGRFAPQWPVPLGVFLAAALLASVFTLSVQAVAGQQEPHLAMHAVAAGIGAVAIALWLSALREVLVRRRLGEAWLELCDGRVREGSACRFTILDPRSALAGKEPPFMRLAYAIHSRRRNGRKLYEDGPYLIEAPVMVQVREDRGGPTWLGGFTIPPGEIKLDADDADWVHEAKVILTVSAATGRSCRFVLPWSHSTGLVGVLRNADSG